MKSRIARATSCGCSSKSIWLPPLISRTSRLGRPFASATSPSVEVTPASFAADGHRGESRGLTLFQGSELADEAKEQLRADLLRLLSPGHPEPRQIAGVP